MLLLILLLSILCIRLSETACEAPNGTKSHFVWKPCSDGPIIYHNITLLDENYTEIYPIYAIKPFIVLTNITNTGEQYDNLEASMKLYRWGGWLGCSWYRIPTFGILDNLIRCNKSIECPIKPGKQQLPVIFDLNEIQFLIRILPDDTLYRIQIEIINKENSLYSCIDLWSIIKTSSETP